MGVWTGLLVVVIRRWLRNESISTVVLRGVEGRAGGVEGRPSSPPCRPALERSRCQHSCPRDCTGVRLPVRTGDPRLTTGSRTVVGGKKRLSFGELTIQPTAFPVGQQSSAPHPVAGGPVTAVLFLRSRGSSLPEEELLIPAERTVAPGQNAPPSPQESLPVAVLNRYEPWPRREKRPG
ncbi:hypothetical protein COCON_G00230300 [Conger conger]|uniref:Uncharacterized protein n=1 Tax=Conger conger TaxID=82655 RepID=A0A9Q1HMZ8_CONCO|nr:hypothetical protein COCON_G00230300 [Conger conger]